MKTKNMMIALALLTTGTAWAEDLPKDSLKVVDIEEVVVIAAPIRNQTPKITPLISSVIVMSSLSCFFFHFFILSKIKFIKK